MESKIIHQQLNQNDDGTLRHTLICYLQYLMDYRRDVPTVEEYIVNELQGLQATKYVQRLKESDAIHQILQLAQDLGINEEKTRTFGKL